MKRNRFVATTAMLSLVIGTVQPLPVLAQTEGVAAVPCVQAEGVICPEAPDETTPPVAEIPAAPAPETVVETLVVPDATAAPVAEAPAMTEAPAASAPVTETPAAGAPAAAPDVPAAATAAAPVAESASEPAAETAAPVAETTPAPATEATVVPTVEPASDVVPAAAPEAQVAPAAEANAAPVTDTQSAPAAETAVAPAPDTLAAPVAEADTQTPTETAPVATDQPTENDRGTAAFVQPTPTTEAVQVLDAILSGETRTNGDATVAPAAAAAEAATGDNGRPAEATVTEITAEETRSSSQEFARPPVVTTEGKKSGLSNFEKFGLLALGGLAVGVILNNGNKVVSNSGDRVVVQQDDGQYYVLKDDDTLLRTPGSRVQTQNFSDGSTLTEVLRDDGTKIVTIRDASGRVLRRARIERDGTETVLINDLASFERIDRNALPAPQPELSIRTSDNGASLRAALAAIEARDSARAYSLRQIRDYREVRALAPSIDVRNITFATGASAIAPDQAEKLADLGDLLSRMVDEDQSVVFLVEGHTDAIGLPATNLALSDRRAESVALALTEYFGVPPENLVVQGYGESDLLIPTDAAEPLNRRVAVRLVSPLMRRLELR